MKDIKVSIIVPVYNLADYVAETLNSTLFQTHENVEVIVVNDASTDCSWSVIEEYQRRDPRIKGINLEKNVGLPAARNIALKASTGEFFVPLDADDWIDAQYVSKTLAKMTEGVGVVSTYMEIFGYWPEMTGQPGSGYPIFSPSKEQILNGNCLPVCSLIRKQTAADVGYYPEWMTRGSEDWAMWAAIVCKTNWKIEILKEHLFHYRTRPNSMSRSMSHIMAPFEEARGMIRKAYGS